MCMELLLHDTSWGVKFYWTHFGKHWPRSDLPLHPDLPWYSLGSTVPMGHPFLVADNLLFVVENIRRRGQGTGNHFQPLWLDWFDVPTCVMLIKLSHVIFLECCFCDLFGWQCLPLPTSVVDTAPRIKHLFKNFLLKYTLSTILC